MARLPGIWQSVDPRVKIVATLSLVLAANLAHSIPILIVLYLLALLVAAAGRIPLGFFVRRVWLFLPFFTAIIALPAIFSFVTPGAPLVVISQHPYIAITEQGVRSALPLLLRVATSVSFGIILILTTRWGELLRSLSSLHVPQVFVLILGMTYRYIFLLLHSANDMFMARKSRQVGRVSGSGERRWIAGSMGALLGKSYHLSDEVYLAMVSRGFRGEAKALEPLRMRAVDWGWLAAAALIPVIVLLVNEVL